MSFDEAWLHLKRIRDIEKALAIIGEYWPASNQDVCLAESFENTACELRRRLRELESEDMRTIEKKMQEKYEGFT